jgi:hypothetical protein
LVTLWGSVCPSAGNVIRIGLSFCCLRYKEYQQLPGGNYQRRWQEHL